MKFRLPPFAKLFREIAGAFRAYRDLFLAWMRALAAQLFPVPVKVRATSSSRTRSHGARRR